MTTQERDGTRPRGRPAGTPPGTAARQLVGHARRVFARHGYDGASMKMIADEAGVTAPALYNHFPSKEELFVAVGIETYEQAYQRYLWAADRSDDFVELICQMLDAWAVMYRDDPDIARFIGAVETYTTAYGHLDPRLQDARARIVQPLVSAVDRAIERDELGPDAVRNQVVALLRLLVLGLTFDAATVGGDHEGAIAQLALLLRGRLFRRT